MWPASVLGVVLFCVLQSSCRAQYAGEELDQQRFCQNFDTCDACVQAASYCVWCYQQDYRGERCGPKSSLLQRYGCAENNILISTDKSEIVRSDSDKNFSDVTDPENLEESVQIKPQKISIKLRPKEPFNFQFTYRPAKNYPLDLYYLMDLTVTMEHDVATMAALGKELTELLRNLTRHSRVAFGYYCDKVAMPFSKMTKEFLENPCADSGKRCEKGFDFVHGLNFTGDVDKFIEKVNSSKTTSNLDNLEGGLDALYQIILCEDYVRWRKNSRKIIVVATDGTLHFAGDGKLAGAVKRNPDRCLLDENGIYSKSLIYDYPSLEELYHRLLQHKMNVLFASKEDSFKYYEDLNKVIPTVSFVGKLEEKSTNVLELVKNGYFNVIKNAYFTTTPNENVDVTLKVNCGKGWNVSNTCDNIELGKEYLFDVTLQLREMPQDVEKETIVIEEKNIVEKLVVDVEYVGRCKCNADGGVERSCSNHGVYKCGVCECEEGWKGVDCEISCVNQKIEECREKNDSYTSSTCYGHGDCFCGKCLCDEEYAGKFCQTKQCVKDKYGEVCGGYFHGECRDGRCQCLEGYAGEDCSCPTSTKNCIAPGSEQVCNEAGECKCGRCVCDQRYSGEYCEICATCTGLCATYEDCVLDTLANVTNSDKCFTDNGNAFMAELVNQSMPVDTTVCYIRHEKADGYICDAQYKYLIRKDFVVELKIYDECGKPVQAGTLIGIIIAAILGMGIMLIIGWKAKLMNDDRREYAKFKEEIARSKSLETNPLYNSPIRTYNMPTELQQFQSRN